MVKKKRTEIFRRPPDQPSDFGFAVWQSVPVLSGVFHQHNDVEVVKMESGSMKYLYGGRLDTLEPGCMSLFWAAIPHQVLGHSPDAFCRGISVPFKWFLNCGFPETFNLRVLHGEVLTGATQPLSDEFSTLAAGWLEDITSDNPDISKAMHVEMDAWFRRFALSAGSSAGASKSQSDTPEIPGDATRDPFRTMIDYISSHYGEFVTTEEITETTGLDHEQALSLFRHRTGEALNDFLNRQRLAFAQLLLVTTDKTVLNIAMESGFNSASRFYTLFKDTVGLSPMDFREEYRYRGSEE